jgi:hypothetical protein
LLRAGDPGHCCVPAVVGERSAAQPIGVRFVQRSAYSVAADIVVQAPRKRSWLRLRRAKHRSPAQLQRASRWSSARQRGLQPLVRGSPAKAVVGSQMLLSGNPFLRQEGAKRISARSRPLQLRKPLRPATREIAQQPAIGSTAPSAMEPLAVANRENGTGRQFGSFRFAMRQRKAYQRCLSRHMYRLSWPMSLQRRAASLPSKSLRGIDQSRQARNMPE